MNKSLAALGLALLGGLASQPVLAADMAVGVRAGTFGFAPEFDVGLTKTLNVRLAYNTFSYKRTIEDTDVTYDGKLKIGAASVIADWHVFNGGFRLSLGAVQKGPKVDVVGKPNANAKYELNGTFYNASDIGSLNGTIKMGDSVAPYVGIGWGNTVDEEDRVTFLFDLGAIHTGSAKADLTVTCNAPSPTLCNQIRNDVNAEKTKLENDVANYDWWPVISLGIAVRF
jgi:hypothetical protein